MSFVYMSGMVAFAKRLVLIATLEPAHMRICKSLHRWLLLAAQEGGVSMERMTEKVPKEDGDD